MEQNIMAINPELSGALVIGAQKLQAALLIEPVLDLPLTTAEQAALIERIWSGVEESNRTAPSHARVEKSFVLVIPMDRRLIRAPKGSFMHVLSINNDDLTSDTRQHVAPAGLGGTTRLVRQQILAVTGWPSLDNDDNLFDRGMDSLQGLQLTRTLRRIFYHPDSALSTVYQNPTVSQLVAAILTPNETVQSERGSIEGLLAIYRKLIHQIPVSKETAEHPKQALISRIFCLNRGKDGGRDTQYNNFVAAGIPTSQLDKRITFIKANVESLFLGLDSTLYDSLRSEVNLIFHAAWPVNFNLVLSAFRPQLAATVHFHIINSRCGGHRHGPAPEKILESLDTPAPFGYDRAKFLAELLVDAGGRYLGNKVPTTVIRVGQVAGPMHSPGIWNPREWLQSVVLSSLHLGQISNSLGPGFDNVDFVPVDLLSDTLVDLATAATTRTADNAATVFNLWSPQLVSWATLLSAIVAIQPLQIVSPATWLASLRASSEVDYEDVAANPAVELLDFFEGLWVIHADTEKVPMQPVVVEKALKASPAMRKLDAVKVEWMHKWDEEWVAARS
ncbi:putative ochratoxin a non-ribosomal peptide synthetase protein [Botrytis fragariae]|uniref:Putative ochratoxin a non-ribosomal peptide synthetase protein n=1 Tax=Botrytis fragariae TaxID=1964551 RepID=A0A8H6AQZ1_9HELO|nr:putative ochratoxin a non-ribosomal peptide synthetase protein [Botrytis fragariae]KAF5872007.1 putative ochratoxin a non-ribosomal peptide synthetase protein [Botrytis fragariae]